MTYSPRWRHQYQRIADVLQQRAEQLRPNPHEGHEQYVHDGRCPICAIVNAAPPLTSEQRAALSRLLPPVEVQEIAVSKRIGQMLAAAPPITDDQRAIAVRILAGASTSRRTK